MRIKEQPCQVIIPDKAAVMLKILSVTCLRSPVFIYQFIKCPVTDCKSHLLSAYMFHSGSFQDSLRGGILRSAPCSDAGYALVLCQVFKHFHQSFSCKAASLPAFCNAETNLYLSVPVVICSYGPGYNIIAMSIHHP